jgi:flagellar assembly protein FliH
MSDGNGSKIAQFQPKTLEKPSTMPAGVEVKSFRPQQFRGDGKNDYQQVKQQFGSLASTDPQSNPQFKLHPESKKHLGIDQEERTHLESIVQVEVESRMQALQKKAYADGFQKGLSDGETKAKQDFTETMQPLFDQFVNLLKEFDGMKAELYQANESVLVQIIFNIGKQVLLQDLKEDADYIKRLSSQIIEKVGVKEQVRMKVSRADFANVESVREFLKTQFPELKNLQIEPSDELELGGCKVETDLSRVNASVETQLKAIETSLGGA